MLTHSIIKRLPKLFEYQSNDRIINIIPSQGLKLYSYVCFMQIHEEKTEFIYFDATNCSIRKVLPLFAVKSSISREITIQKEEVTCQKILKNLVDIFFGVKNKFTKYLKLD